MGLDAWVYCDCFERGQLRELPPHGVTLQLGPDGGMTADVDHLPLEKQIEFDAWREESACEHRRGELLHHRLGNISLVAWLRNELSPYPGVYPVLLQKVLYSGFHAGDWLPLEDFAALESELNRLRSFRSRRSPFTEQMQQHWAWFGRRFPWRFRSTTSDEFVRGFRMQMEELLEAARKVRKPIVF